MSGKVLETGPWLCRLTCKMPRIMLDGKCGWSSVTTSPDALFLFRIPPSVTSVFKPVLQPTVLHITSPKYKSIQATQRLTGFWQPNAYSRQSEHLSAAHKTQSIKFLSITWPALNFTPFTLIYYPEPPDNFSCLCAFRHFLYFMTVLCSVNGLNRVHTKFMST